MKPDIKHLGRVDYLPTWQAMQTFTAASSRETTSQIGTQPLCDGRDQLWICEHFPVYTQGLAGKAEHVLNPGDIPVVATDRGGQVTYHGPGQVVAYPLLDLTFASYYVNKYMYRMEESVHPPAAISSLAAAKTAPTQYAQAERSSRRPADPG